MQWTLLRLFKKSGSDNPLLFHYLTPLPRVNRRARPRLVAIIQGYRYLGRTSRTHSHEALNLLTISSLEHTGLKNN
jgi:hypothetical protein